jgi:flagellum-specific peptidoglycan hydrolase FlgJ
LVSELPYTGGVYLQLLVGNSRYAPAWQQYRKDTGVEGLLQGICATGYATPEYLATLTKILKYAKVQDLLTAARKDTDERINKV